jgi:hypothetical protein
VDLGSVLIDEGREVDVPGRWVGGQGCSTTISV